MKKIRKHMINSKYIGVHYRNTDIKTNIKEVYNFVLDNGHVMDINGFNCVTLGHGFDDNDVIKHDFFGNMDRIKRSLSRIGNFEAGYVEIDHSNIKRSLDGLVNDFC